MPEIDVNAIVPSTRDLLQVVATRRRSLALIAEVGPEQPDTEAARLYDMNISAFAFADADEALRTGARSTKTVPSLCLAAAADRQACLAARFFGADGVCIDALRPQEEWDQLAMVVRTTRMLPLALVTNADSAKNAVTYGARALLLRADTAAEVIALAESLPRGLVLVAHVPNADADALRSLLRKVDAAIAPKSVHTQKGFAALVTDLDP